MNISINLDLSFLEHSWFWAWYFVIGAMVSLFIAAVACANGAKFEKDSYLKLCFLFSAVFFYWPMICVYMAINAMRSRWGLFS